MAHVLPCLAVTTKLDQDSGTLPVAGLIQPERADRVRPLEEFERDLLFLTDSAGLVCGKEIGQPLVQAQVVGVRL